MTIVFWIKRAIRVALGSTLVLSILSLGVLLAPLTRLGRSRTQSPRLVWGATPIINNKYWSIAMRQRGYSSRTVMRGVYSAINKPLDFDEILPDRRELLALELLLSLLKYDVFFISFDGWLLGNTSFWRMEGLLLRLAGKKIVVIPYGSDALVYRLVRSPTLLHGLMMSYPDASRRQHEIDSKLQYWIKQADCVLPGAMAGEGFGRWDVLSPSVLHVDTSTWSISDRKSGADGVNGVVYVAHAPNHRGVKGTEFLLRAIRALQDEGLRVELILIERMQNEQVRQILMHQADILVEQLILGYALNAIEGMACGLPVVSNLDEMDMKLTFRRWSFLDECPIVSATPEDIADVLRKLITRPDLRAELGAASRLYAEKYHGLDSAAHLFEAVLGYLYGRRDLHSLVNLYNPLLSEYSLSQPKVSHPLVNNRIVG